MKLSGKLKSATAKKHEQLEQAMFGEPIMNNTLDIQQYKEMLEIQYSIVEPFEDEWKQIADKNEEVAILWHERWKVPLLREDLQSLGEEHFKIEKYIFNHWDFEQLLGAAYVLEGSTLGGKVITKKLHENPAIPNNIMKYFAHYGDKTGKKWKSFLQFLNSKKYTEKAVIDGAEKTFELFIKKAEEIKTT